MLAKTGFCLGKEEMISKEIPLGLGFQLNKEAFLLKALPVANEVYWVNPDLELPFKVEEGQPCHLALMITPHPCILEENDSQFTLEAWPKHRRTGILGRVIVRDVQGQFYRDLCLKGCGRTTGSEKTNEFSVVPAAIEEEVSQRLFPKGMADLSYLLTERNTTEELYKNGIRTYRIAALLEIKEIIDRDGKIISVEKAKAKRIIREERQPAMALRAFVTKARLEEAKYNPLAIKDAMILVAGELGRDPKDFSATEYVFWLAETLARELAKIHNLGFTHGYISPHNVTLDGRIVDTDGMDKLANQKMQAVYMEIDYEKGIEALTDLLLVKWAKFDFFPGDRMTEIYEDTYSWVLKEEWKKIINDHGDFLHFS